MLPDADGLITTDDGSRVLFRLRGRTPTTGDASGEQLVRVEFLGEPPNEWLNLVFAVGEGRVDFETMRALIRVFECVHELR